ncbi:NUDIX domain-containing protein [candidate division KSB1 bacterium]|nr:NUDIX domain-containing protein [candidate division KSB1 bacterium]
MKSIRFKAVAVFSHKERVLVHQLENKSTGETWFIPPGGGVEYGESSLAALKREIKEELGWAIQDEKLIGAFESFHFINGREEHEVTFVYFATPINKSVLKINRYSVLEEDGRNQLYRWRSFRALRKPGSLLYPKGLLERISSDSAADRLING